MNQCKWKTLLLSGVKLSLDGCLVCLIPVTDSPYILPRLLPDVSGDKTKQDKWTEMLDRQMKINLKQVTKVKSDEVSQVWGWKQKITC